MRLVEGKKEKMEGGRMVRKVRGAEEDEESTNCGNESWLDLIPPSRQNLPFPFSILIFSPSFFIKLSYKLNYHKSIFYNF